MNFRSIAWRLEECPWKWPLNLGGGVQMLRSRAIIEAIDADGFRHEAELGPCPGVHPETLDEAQMEWQQKVEPQLLRGRLAAHLWDWQKPWFGLIDLPASPLTSVQTAAEQMLLSWAQSQNPEEISLVEPMVLPGSALLPLLPERDHARNWQEFIQLYEQGFRVFKCKIGRNPAAADIAFLQRLSQHSPSALLLRLDANQNLSVEDETLWKQAALQLPIQYWEEPDVNSDLHPLAWDETLWNAEVDALQDSPAVWILKPSRLTLSRSIALLKRAEQQNRSCVLSNAFDSGLSLRCFAWIYAAFCKNPQALGFGTARFLPEDSWNSGSFADPLVKIPIHPFAMTSGDEA